MAEHGRRLPACCGVRAAVRSGTQPQSHLPPFPAPGEKAAWAASCSRSPFGSPLGVGCVNCSYSGENDFEKGSSPPMTNPPSSSRFRRDPLLAARIPGGERKERKKKKKRIKTTQSGRKSSTPQNPRRQMRSWKNLKHLGGISGFVSKTLADPKRLFPAARGGAERGARPTGWLPNPVFSAKEARRSPHR